MNGAPAETGRDIALKLQRAYPDEDWMAALADRAGDTRETIEWHLQEAMSPPVHICKAAALLLADARDTMR